MMENELQPVNVPIFERIARMAVFMHERYGFEWAALRIVIVGPSAVKTDGTGASFGLVEVVRCGARSATLRELVPMQQIVVEGDQPDFYGLVGYSMKTMSLVFVDEKWEELLPLSDQKFTP